MTARALTVALALVCCGCVPREQEPRVMAYTGWNATVIDLRQGKWHVTFRDTGVLVLSSGDTLRGDSAARYMTKLLGGAK